MTEETSKPGQSDSQQELENATPASNDIKDSTSADKALKKKLKKERQKKKKNSGKEKQEVTTSVDELVSSNVPTLTMKNSNEIHEANESNNDVDSDNDSDIDFNSIVVPAFVKSSIVGKKDTLMKVLKNINDSTKGEDNSVNDVNRNAAKQFPDESNGFTCVKKGSKQTPPDLYKRPEDLGNQALKVIGFGNFPLAIDYLTAAIKFDRTDTRHYINRSYCYLRTGNYARALADIKYASDNFSDVTERARAKCREGQAHCGLQNYESAERAFEECIKLMPNCPYAKRELKRAQLMQMVNMGCDERKAILALEKEPQTTDAIMFITSNSSIDNNSCDSTESETEDEIFFSDTEECPSNERLLSKMLNYDPNLPDEPHVPEPLSANKTINNWKLPSRTASLDRELKVIKTISQPAKPNQSINEMALWVGNMNYQITDSMMTKRFGKFGKVIQVWRSPITTYCFVNFQSPDSAKKALEEASFNNGNIDVGGYLLPIKPANTKSFK